MKRFRRGCDAPVAGSARGALAARGPGKEPASAGASGVVATRVSALTSGDEGVAATALSLRRLAFLVRHLNGWRGFGKVAQASELAEPATKQAPRSVKRRRRLWQNLTAAAVDLHLYQVMCTGWHDVQNPD